MLLSETIIWNNTAPRGCRLLLFKAHLFPWSGVAIVNSLVYVHKANLQESIVNSFHELGISMKAIQRNKILYM